jgi:type 1 glutamine amidotransferase
MMKKNVILVTDGWIHPPLMARFWLSYTLTMPEYQYKRVRSMEALVDMDLVPFRALVLYFHHDKISERALDALDGFVSGGGGVLAIHSVTASFKDADRFTDLLGGKFVRHGPVEPFEVRPTSPESGIFRGISSFTVLDELYIHDLQPDIETHFATIFEGRPVPIVWTRIHGQGRICYACPGHRSASLRVPEYQQVLNRGLNWVCENSG